MRNRWCIDNANFQSWLAGRSLPGLDLGRPTVQNVIVLALIDSHGRYLSYDDLNQIFRAKRVVRNQTQGSASIPIPTLRVAIAGLLRRLDSKQHFYCLRSEKMGKTSQFALVDRNRIVEPVTDLPRSDDEPLIQPRDITRRLVRDGGGLPFASSYCCARAAAHWLHFSAPLSEAKKHYEAGAFDAYAIGGRMGLRGRGGEMGVVSLAPGEGLGEVELLERLLRAKDLNRPKRVQYVAIDTSEYLLTAHSQIIRERFADEIASGALQFSPLVGNLFQLRRCLAILRMKWGADLLSEMPILVTYFGNCLGNFENHEWDFFRAVLDAFFNHSISILMGISLARTKGDRVGGDIIEERYYTLESFYLETPRHLMYDLGLLHSETEKGKKIEVGKTSEFRSAGMDVIPAHRYDTPDGIFGSVYRFYYRLKHDLVTWDARQRLPKNSDLLLFSIVKYDLNSLVRFLQQRGFDVQAPPTEYKVQRIADASGDFRYVVFAANWNGNQ